MVASESREGPRRRWLRAKRVGSFNPEPTTTGGLVENEQEQVIKANDY